MHGSTYFFPQFFMFDPMSDLTAPSGGDDMLMGNGEPSRPAAPRPASRPYNNGGGGGQFAKDVHSVTIQARQRTFYIDLKESGHGKFFKVSEKSRGGQTKISKCEESPTRVSLERRLSRIC